MQAQWNKLSIGELKSELHSLKLGQPKDIGKIKLLEKCIRNKLDAKKSEIIPDLDRGLNKSFWKTCEKLFTTCSNILPPFSLQVAYDYFTGVLSCKAHSNFAPPAWFPPLPSPTTSFNTSPPSYQEVTKAINRMKNKSSPCPLDQIPIIAFKKCPILRTFLHKLLYSSWSQSDIPSIWGWGLTILIYKKGSSDNPENFRPITLQPVGYKILSSIIRSRITTFLTVNKFVNTTIQKGFWPKSNGVTEHTSILTHLIEDTKRHHGSLVVAVLDLRNAFGVISHDLLYRALELHCVPPQVISLISNIYKCANVNISVNNSITNSIKVGWGVLQGDPYSPLLFNVCFNILIRTISQDKFNSLGFAWGPSRNLCGTSWLQFADDSALVSHDCKSAQTLVDIASAWCKWSNIYLHPDICVTCGMAKIDGGCCQFDSIQGQSQGFLLMAPKFRQ